jgi:hypothetical protein
LTRRLTIRYRIVSVAGIGIGALPDGLDPNLIQNILSGALLYQILLEPAGQTGEQLREYIVGFSAASGFSQDE